MFKKLKYLFLAFLCWSSLYGESYSDLLNKCDPQQSAALQKAKDSLGLSEETQFQPLKGGLTKADVYSFEIDGQKFVLRFLALMPSHTQEMRRNELKALAIAHQIGIAPHCIFSDQNALLMVMPFIEGHPLKNPDEKQLAQLGTMLKKLHSYSDTYPTRYSLKDRLQLHYQKGLKYGIAYPTGFDQEVQATLNKPCLRPLVPSHGDLNSSNILVDDSNKIHIIDWTTATMQDPFMDLSYFCLLSNLSPTQEKVFLEAYFDRAPLEKELEALQEEKARVCLLTATLWFRFSEPPEERALPLGPRIAALDAELNSPYLKRAQDYLKEGIVVDLHNAPNAEIRSYALSFYKAYLDHL